MLAWNSCLPDNFWGLKTVLVRIIIHAVSPLAATALPWRDESLYRPRLSAKSCLGRHQSNDLATAAGQWQPHPC